MQLANKAAAGPLKHHSVEEIKFLLRGFPDSAISSALSLRIALDKSEIESCLHGILKFYLPTGAQPREITETGKIRIRDDLGLDSLSIAESMYKIEEIFNVDVETQEFTEIVTIADASALLTDKLTESDTACQ